MPIRERKNKTGIVFDITVNDGYKLDVHGNKVQKQKNIRHLNHLKI